MEWIIWILVIIIVVAIVVWMLRRNSGPTAGGNTPEQRHPGNQPGSGANDPVMEAGPPVSNTPAAGTAGSGATGSVTDRGAAGDTNAVSEDDERIRDGGSDITDQPTAADRGTKHTTTAGPVDGGSQDHADDDTPHGRHRNDGDADTGGTDTGR